MTRRLIILLSFLLVISPVTSVFAAQAGHGHMEHSSNMKLAEMNDAAGCMQAVQDQTDKSCCQDEQCNKHCQTMQCHNAGKLPAISLDSSFETGFSILTQSHARLFHAPGNGISNTLLRPPIVHL